MKIVQEMYARGFEFIPVDLYTAQAHRFQIVEGRLMPALDTIGKVSGDKAADAVVLAARDGKFLSKDDFRNRTKVSKTVIDLMDDLNLFGDIPDSNQISILILRRADKNCRTFFAMRNVRQFITVKFRGRHRADGHSVRDA